MRFVLLLALLLLPVSAFGAEAKQVIFAGGHFWSLQPVFNDVPGVERTVAGYIGGHVANPVYADVVKGKTGHRLAVLVIYDPAVISFEKLLQVYWHNIDPVDTQGQFCERGRQFSSAVYYLNPEQKMIAEDSRMLMETDNSALADANGNDIHVGAQILPASVFYPAEIGQQNYYQKNPLRYRFYARTCAREQGLYKIWGSPKT